MSKRLNGLYELLQKKFNMLMDIEQSNVRVFLIYCLKNNECPKCVLNENSPVSYMDIVNYGLKHDALYNEVHGLLSMSVEHKMSIIGYMFRKRHFRCYYWKLIVSKLWREYLEG